MRPYALIIDHESCWGCKTCEVACKQENRVPDGIKLISVTEDGPRMIDGRLHFMFRVDACRHCDEPDCAAVCPEEAIQKRDDGMVILSQKLCSGCGTCAEACPYDAISMDPESGLVGKCNLCHHRVDQGLIPACADNICLAHCIYFGDPEEIKAQIAKKHRDQLAAT